MLKLFVNLQRNHFLMLPWIVLNGIAMVPLGIGTVMLLIVFLPICKNLEIFNIECGCPFLSPALFPYRWTSVHLVVCLLGLSEGSGKSSTCLRQSFIDELTGGQDIDVLKATSRDVYQF